jgi:hypothetical protein
MGLLLIQVRFRGRAPPLEEEFKRELAALAGSIDGLDDYAVDGELATITMEPRPVLTAYALRLLLDRGGDYVTAAGAPRHSLRLPFFVERPWRAWPWYTRLRLRLWSHLDLSEKE